MSIEDVLREMRTGNAQHREWADSVEVEIERLNACVEDYQRHKRRLIGDLNEYDVEIERLQKDAERLQKENERLKTENARLLTQLVDEIERRAIEEKP